MHLQVKMKIVTKSWWYNKQDMLEGGMVECLVDMEINPEALL